MRLAVNCQSVSFVSLLILASVAQRQANAFIKTPTRESLEKLLGFDIVEGKISKSLLEPIDLFLEDILPTWFQQAPNNENGTRAEFKEYNLRDTSNDDALRLTGQELLTRSGFKYEVFDAIAEDGYITQLTHVINPLADRTQLRQPPVLMEHGGTIDPTAYLVASSIQHFPEPWPRAPGDGPMRSWNRSLAFQLANNGFDVWLAETRGSNDNNKRHIRTPALENMMQGKLAVANHSMLEQVNEVLQSINFWAFSQDDIIAHEFKSHIDSVLKLTGSTKVNLFTFSLSTPTSLAFLGERPDYAQKVHGFVSMAPIISGEGTSKFINLLFKTLCALLPDEVGTLLLTDVLFTQPFRELLVLLSRNKEIRYILFKSVSTLLMGASPKWQTLLELNLIGHLFRQLSFRELKQMCQQMSSNQLQKFDYGPIKNQLLYNQLTPPVYNISDLKIKDWIVVSGSNDALSTPQVIEHLISIVNPKPIAHIVAPNFNHLDLFAGWENDIYVNEPIMRYFERMSHLPGQSETYARNLDLKSFMPEFLHPEKFVGQAQNITKQLIPGTALEPKVFLETLSKSLKVFIETFTGEFGKLLVPKLPLVDTILKGTNEREKGSVEVADKWESKQKEAASEKGEKGTASRNPIERMLQELKVPGLDVSKFGQMLSNLGPKKGPFADMIENLKGIKLGEDMFANLKSFVNNGSSSSGPFKFKNALASGTKDQVPLLSSLPNVGAQPFKGLAEAANSFGEGLTKTTGLADGGSPIGSLTNLMKGTLTKLTPRDN